MDKTDRLDPIQRHLALLRRDVDNRTARLGAIRTQQTDLSRMAELLRHERADLLAVIEKLEA